MYVIKGDFTPEYPDLVIVDTLKEAMIYFDRMTRLYNKVYNEHYYTTKEMDIYTEEDFLEFIEHSGTDKIWCYKLEEFAKDSRDYLNMKARKYDVYYDEGN